MKYITKSQVTIDVGAFVIKRITEPHKETRIFLLTGDGWEETKAEYIKGDVVRPLGSNLTIGGKLEVYECHIYID